MAERERRADKESEKHQGALRQEEEQEVLCDTLPKGLLLMERTEILISTDSKLDFPVLRLFCPDCDIPVFTSACHPCLA